MDLNAFSPRGGLLAVAGRNGNLHLVDWQSGGGQVVGTMKCPGSASGGIKSLWWADDGTLATLTADAEVFLWDIGQRKCSRRWKDEGGFRGTSRTMSGCADWLAIGSNTGLVNVYESDSFAKNREGQPNTRKTLGNLTTAISSMTFNHDAQLMAIASKEKKDSMKLVSILILNNYVSDVCLDPLPIPNCLWKLAHVKYACRPCYDHRFFPQKRLSCYREHERKGVTVSSEGL